MSERPHISVMLKETLSFFEDREIKIFYEGTVGAGGHAQAILSAHPEIETYCACDRDQSALEIARKTLEPWKDKVVFIHGNFADLKSQLKERQVKKVDGFFLIWGSRRCRSIKARGDSVLVRRGL